MTLAGQAPVSAAIALALLRGGVAARPTARLIGEQPEAKITSVEVLQADLKPKVTALVRAHRSWRP